MWVPGAIWEASKWQGRPACPWLWSHTNLPRQHNDREPATGTSTLITEQGAATRKAHEGHVGPLYCHHFLWLSKAVLKTKSHRPQASLRHLACCSLSFPGIPWVRGATHPSCHVEDLTLLTAGSPPHRAAHGPTPKEPRKLELRLQPHCHAQQMLEKSLWNEKLISK